MKELAEKSLLENMYILQMHDIWDFSNHKGLNNGLHQNMVYLHFL